MAEGQFLGPKGTFIYVSDTNDTYTISRDRTLANVAGTGLNLATVANSAGAGTLPRRFKPRVVFWEPNDATAGSRKEIICGSASAPLYVAGTSQPLTIDGEAGVTTGRRGEQASYLKLDAAAPPA